MMAAAGAGALMAAIFLSSRGSDDGAIPSPSARLIAIFRWLRRRHSAGRRADMAPGADPPSPRPGFCRHHGWRLVAVRRAAEPH